MKKVTKNDKTNDIPIEPKIYDLDSDSDAESSNGSSSSLANIFESFKGLVQIPQIPQYDLPLIDEEALDWIGEQNEKKAYLAELQIKQLEEQLAISKNSQFPKYDISTGVISFLGKEIDIPLNTNLEMICRIVLKNIANMKRKWTWDEIVEANRENPANFTYRVIYTASRSVTEKVAHETTVKDFFITKPTTTVQLNPKYLPK